VTETGGIVGEVSFSPYRRLQLHSSFQARRTTASPACIHPCLRIPV